MTPKMLLGFVAFVGMLSAAHADSAIDLENVGWGGIGCPAGSVKPHLRISEVTGRLIVSFDTSEMRVKVGQGAVDRRACSLAIPVRVPEGKRLVLSDPAVFGDVDLPARAKAHVQVESFFAGSSGPVLRRDFDSRERRSYYSRSDETISAGCGVDQIARINVAIVAQRLQAEESGALVVDGIAANLALKDCR